MVMGEETLGVINSPSGRVGGRDPAETKTRVPSVGTKGPLVTTLVTNDPFARVRTIQSGSGRPTPVHWTTKGDVRSLPMKSVSVLLLKRVSLLETRFRGGGHKMLFGGPS